MQDDQHGRGLGSILLEHLAAVAREAGIGRFEAFTMPNNQKMLRVFDLVAQVAPSRSTVMIQGESGTGKELIAKAIHAASSRTNYPFIPVNCGALPEDLVENELFGHARGAYTGAAAPGKGLLAEAEGGTLFLDELNSLSLSAQARPSRLKSIKCGSPAFLDRSTNSPAMVTNASRIGGFRSSTSAAFSAF